MKVKAKVTFGGQYAMYKGDVAEIPEGPVADILISGGYIEAVSSDAAAVDHDDEGTEQEQEEILEEAAEIETEYEAEPDDVELKKMTVADLIQLAEDNEIEVDPKAKKAEIIAQIESELDSKESEEEE